jgi:hypothetical protein
MRAQQMCTLLTVHTVTLIRVFELNSKFDKTYKTFSKVLSKFDMSRNSLFICMTYYFTNKSFQYFNRKTCFNVKACLLFMNKFVII